MPSYVTDEELAAARAVLAETQAQAERLDARRRFTPATTPNEVWPCASCGAVFFHREDCATPDEVCEPAVVEEAKPAEPPLPVWGLAWTDAGPDRDSRLRCEGCHRCVYYSHATSHLARAMMTQHVNECPDAAELAASEQKARTGHNGGAK